MSKNLAKEDGNLPPSKAILKIQHRIAYMEQELEFIKKLYWRITITASLAQALMLELSANVPFSRETGIL